VEFLGTLAENVSPYAMQKCYVYKYLGHADGEKTGYSAGLRLSPALA